MVMMVVAAALVTAHELRSPPQGRPDTSTEIVRGDSPNNDQGRSIMKSPHVRATTELTSKPIKATLAISALAFWLSVAGLLWSVFNPDALLILLFLLVAVVSVIVHVGAKIAKWWGHD